MATDAELLEQLKKQALRRARITSVILGGAFVVAVLFMVYGLTRDIEATRNLEMAIANEKIAIAAKKEADMQRDIANEQTALALLRERELEEKNKQVREALEGLQKKLADCGKKK